MRRFVVSLLSSVLAFTAGLVTAASWGSNARATHEPVTIKIQEPCAPTPPQPPAPVQSFTVTPPHEFDFGQKGLKLVPERVQMKSESAGYDIDVSYPQIVGTPGADMASIWKINRHLKEEATQLYKWPLKSSETPRRSFEARSGTRDTVNFTYHVALATDFFLGINFIGYSYDGVTQSQLKDSFTLNYDLKSGKNLKLSEIFKPGSNYLDFISRYCVDEISRHFSGTSARVASYALIPLPQNFEAWQISANGLTFNFYACKVVDCSEGDQSVTIPWDDLKPMLNPGIPGKFEITYP